MKDLDWGTIFKIGLPCLILGGLLVLGGQAAFKKKKGTAQDGQSAAA